MRQLPLITFVAVVTETEAMLRRVVRENIKIVTRLEKELGKIKADGGQLQQCILNLAVNARDAMPEGGTLMIETENILLTEAHQGRHDVVRPGHYVLLSVTDNGSGMSPDVQNRIFEPFYTTKPKGCGNSSLVRGSNPCGPTNTQKPYLVPSSCSLTGCTNDLLQSMGPATHLASFPVAPSYKLLQILDLPETFPLTVCAMNDAATGFPESKPARIRNRSATLLPRMRLPGTKTTLHTVLPFNGTTPEKFIPMIVSKRLR